MGIKGKLEVEMDVTCHCDILHELFSKKPHNVCDISPKDVHSCDVVEGQFGEPESVIFWNFTMDGKRCVSKNIVEVIDDEKKLVRYKVMEGDLLNEFKSMTIVVQVIPKGEIAGVILTIEFEKLHDQVDYPTNVMDLCVGATKDIEAHYLNK